MSPAATTRSNRSQHYHIRRRRLPVIVLGCAVLALLVFGIAQRDRGAQEPWRAHPVVSFEEAPGDLLYSVGIHCHPEARASVDEGDDQVVVSLEVRGDGGDCTTSEAIVLERPIGDRAVIDAATGDEIDLGSP